MLGGYSQNLGIDIMITATVWTVFISALHLELQIMILPSYLFLYHTLIYHLNNHHSHDQKNIQ
jgi:hypothetical protein